MQRSTKTSYVVKGNVTAQHIGDSFGDNVYHQQVANTASVLDALKLILDDQRIWARQDLERERTAIAEAVDAGLPEQPAVRSAVRRVLDVAGAIIVGVAGNTVYEVLKHFALR
jgi:hypothetical protein